METTWQTPTGWMIVRDNLVVGPWHDLETRSRDSPPHPMDWDAEHILLRTVRCVSGTVELVMNCEPSFDYGRIQATWSTPQTPTARRSPGVATPTRTDAAADDQPAPGLEGHEAAPEPG